MAELVRRDAEKVGDVDEVKALRFYKLAVFGVYGDRGGFHAIVQDGDFVGVFYAGLAFCPLVA